MLQNQYNITLKMHIIICKKFAVNVEWHVNVPSIAYVKNSLLLGIIKLNRDK